MRASRIVLLFVVGWAGCLGQLVPDGPKRTASETTPDLAPLPSSPEPTEDLLGRAGDPAAGARDLATTPAADAGMLAGFGAVCTANGDCQSDICQPANMGANMECTQTCTMIGVADPACPNAGMCNMKGYCKP